MPPRTSTVASGFAAIHDLDDLSESRFDMDQFSLHTRHPSTGAEAAYDGRAEAGANLDDEEADEGKKIKVIWGVPVRAVMYVLLWYCFSISLSVYNKFMFSSEGLDFRFPIIITSVHQLVQILLSLLALYVIKTPITSASFSERIRVIPASMASAADIGLGNTSLIIVTLSFYTMIKSSALGFVLLFSILFRLETPSWQLGMNIGVMTIGVFMMVAGETEFNLPGLLLVLGAACASGLRWALVKILLNGGSARPQAAAKNKVHPLQTILAISPGMFVILAVLGGIVEGYKSFLTADMWSQRSILLGIIYLLLPGVLAFCMTWSEFELLNVTGPLSLAIAGICKEVATILVAMVTFRDKLSVVNCIGVVVTIGAIAMYHIFRPKP